MTSAVAVQTCLQAALGKMGSFSTCALLNYPNYINLGDHLIWLGNLFYLRRSLGTRIAYAASAVEFSPTDLAMATDRSPVPILLSGGGSLGDLWYGHQRFREQIIQRYPDRPIVILPQTMYFQDGKKLAQAARIFNAHPALTIFTRDRVSHTAAQEAFYNCQVELAPDTAFQITCLADFPMPSPRRGILYHCRTDAELLTQVALAQLPLPLDMSDWQPYEDHWLMGSAAFPLKQTMATVIREGWQRGPRRPREWWSRRTWEGSFCPHTLLNSVYAPLRQRQSWSFVHSAVYQFRQYQLIITNRLHGHILATLLGIPHVFLPNNYHKNQAFYETWTSNIPYCKFVSEPEKISVAVNELLNFDHKRISMSVWTG